MKISTLIEAWISDIKCWRSISDNLRRSISDNLRGYIKNQTQCFSRHILIRWSWSTFFNPRFGVLSRKLGRTPCFVFDVMVSKPWISSLTLIPPRFSFTGLHVNTRRSDLCNGNLSLSNRTYSSSSTYMTITNFSDWCTAIKTQKWKFSWESLSGLTNLQETSLGV